MGDNKPSWDDIPSLEGLEVDWDYEPENPLGKRAHVRLANPQLTDVVGRDEIGVKIGTSKGELNGYLVDISQGGLAVMLEVELLEGLPVKLGLFLGNKKILANGLVRGVTDIVGKYRTGVEFKNLKEEYAEYIGGLVAANTYRART